MSYWKSGDKITLPQTDVKISAEGPTNFTENNVIGIYIPPEIRFFSGKDCLLEFDVLLDGDTANFNNMGLMLDGETGANSLFSMCRVYAGNRATLIEETDEYSTMVSVKYSYDANDSKRQARALTEGAGAWCPDARGTLGSTKSIQNNMFSNPYMTTPNLNVDDNTTLTAPPTFIKAKVQLQVHMGVFANNEKAFPNMLTDGCYVEFTCAQNRGVFRSYDGGNHHRKVALNPSFHGIDDAGTKLAINGSLVSFQTTTDNVQISPANSPFQVGESIGFKNASTGANVDFVDGTDAKAPAVITSITKNASGRLTYAINNGSLIFASAEVDPADPWHVVSRSLRDGAKDGSGKEWSPSYTISDVNLIVRRIDMGGSYESSMMSRMKEGGVIMFDIPSVRCHKQSILSGDVQATISLPIEHAKARSIINVPTDSKIYTAKQNTDSDGTYIINNKSRDYINRTDRSGISGIGNNLTEYSYLLEGRIVPSRPISTAKSSSTGGGVDANHLIELEKSLQSGGITPLSFQDFKNNFCIGRALTLDRNTIYDGRGKDCRLNVRYESTDGVPKDTLWKSFVYHIRTLAIKNNNIEVEV